MDTSVLQEKTRICMLHLSRDLSLTAQVELCQRVSGGRAHCCQQVDGVVGEAVTVGEVQFC